MKARETRQLSSLASPSAPTECSLSVCWYQCRRGPSLLDRNWEYTGLAQEARAEILVDDSIEGLQDALLKEVDS
jgi:hypothetical protein